MDRTERDSQILDALACRVRQFSTEQIADHWWATAANRSLSARRRINRLVADGWLYRTDVHAGPLLALSEPLVTWAPGKPPPDCAVLAARLRDRWASAAPPAVIPVVAATRQTLDEFGGPPRPKRLDALYATHDLNVAALYLLFCRTRPDEAAHWLGEDIRPKAGYRLKDPDAVIEFPNGRPDLVVEMGGRYDEPTLRAFHEDCARRGRRYELW